MPSNALKNQAIDKVIEELINKQFREDDTLLRFNAHTIEAIVDILGLEFVTEEALGYANGKHIHRHNDRVVYIEDIGSSSDVV